ncbi:MAG: DUF1292 domain-containing protein [Oscillospiraceae bacterium]|nr:DUF1292 domain-containing protein [Oscillospiraceae bacterium]
MADILKENEILDDDNAREVVDLEGEPFEIIGELEHEGEIYLALIPYEEEEDREKETEFIILKEEEENDEVFLATVDDDELYEKIGAMFLNSFAESAESEEE